MVTCNDCVSTQTSSPPNRTVASRVERCCCCRYWPVSLGHCTKVSKVTTHVYVNLADTFASSGHFSQVCRGSSQRQICLCVSVASRLDLSHLKLLNIRSFHKARISFFSTLIARQEGLAVFPYYTQQYFCCWRYFEHSILHFWINLNTQAKQKKNQ